MCPKMTYIQFSWLDGELLRWSLLAKIVNFCTIDPANFVSLFIYCSFQTEEGSNWMHNQAKDLARLPTAEIAYINEWRLKLAFTFFGVDFTYQYLDCIQ